MAGNGKQRRRQKPQQHQPAPEPEPRRITRLYGDASGNDPVDFDAASPQHESKFISKLPAEIRALVFAQVWRDAGLSQHLLPQRVVPEGARAGHIRYFHARCVTLHDDPAPDHLRGPPPDNLDFRVARRRRGTDPAFKDGTDPMWKEDCYFCKYFYDSAMDPKNLPSPPVERNSPFMPLLLCCKAIHREVFQSIADNVCFQFMGDSAAGDFLGRIRLPITQQMRHLMVKSNFEVSEAGKYDWSRLTTLLGDLPNLRHLTVWMDFGQKRWRNNRPRHALEHARLLTWFAQVPTHINLRATVPLVTLEEGMMDGKGLFALHVKYIGGVVEGATLGMAIGDVAEQTRIAE